MRIFYGECKTEYAFDLLEALSKTNHEVTHIGIHGTAKEIQKFKRSQNLSGITIVNSHSLYKRDSLKKHYKNYFEPLDPLIISAFEDIERDFYILTDRSNYDSITFRERKLYFYDLIRFWLGYLKEENIEAVYFPYAPHTGWMLVLMQAAKYLDIPFLYFSHTAINNRSLLRESYKEIIDVPDGYLANLSLEEIMADINPELLKDFKADSVVTEAVKEENDVFNRQSINFNSSLVRKVKNKISVKSFVRKTLSYMYHNCLNRYKHKFYFPMSMDCESSYALWTKAKRKHIKFSKKLKNKYEDLTCDIDLSQDYVYFPLHLQPEMTTQPEAGIFEDHYLVLEQIIKALPKGWKIYVKENPRQYDVTINAVSAMHFRDVQDLENLLEASPNVSFVKQSVKTVDLIQNAKAVVTQTGTVGWECLTSGKPIISMAKPWYSGCASCYRVGNADEMSVAFDKVLESTKESVQSDLMRYLHFYQDKLFIGSLADPTNVAYNTVPYRALIDNHCQEISEKFKK